jgi:hypothetical protein
MCHPSSNSRSFAILVAFLTGLGPMLASFAPSRLLAVDKPAAASNAPQLTIGKGEFVSFEDGVLTLEGSAGPLGANKDKADRIVWKNINDNTKTYLGVAEDKGGPDRGYKQVPTLETLKKVKPGTPMFVGPWFGYQDRPGIFIGINKSRTVGTFVSYTTGSKSSGLALLAKNLTPSGYTKKYGDSLFMRNISESIPVEESVDGGPYQPVGTVKTVLADVKEGTLVTVHFHGEGVITLIQLGLPKEK